MPSLPIKLRPLAKRDIKEILKYTQQQWGIEQRDRYKTLLDTSIKAIARFPNKGKHLEGLPGGVLACHTGRHLVIYQPLPTHIDVIRVLYDAMDLKRHF